MYGVFLSLQQIKTVEINGDSHGRPIKPIQTAIEVRCENILNMTTRNYYSYNGSIKNITKTFLSYFIEVNTKYGPLSYINEKQEIVGQFWPNNLCLLSVSSDDKNGAFLEIQIRTLDNCSWFPTKINAIKLSYSNNNQPVGIIGWLNSSNQVNSKLEDSNDWVNGLLPANYLSYLTKECVMTHAIEIEKWYEIKLNQMTYYNEYVTERSFLEIIAFVVSSLSIQFAIIKFLTNIIILKLVPYLIFQRMQKTLNVNYVKL
jgi:hypothetical protein